MHNNLNIIIIGSGTAGLTIAIKLSQKYKIALFCQHNIINNASFYAQGGIATAYNHEDSLDYHIKDTITGGNGLCEIEFVKFVIQYSKKALKWLIKNNNINFTKKKDWTYHLTREGGHSFRRIFHYKDQTGKEIQKKLLKTIKKTPNIFVYENYKIINFVTQKKICIGVSILDTKIKKLLKIFSQITIIASGGYSGLYKFTTNKTAIYGKGISLAFNKGCRIANLEFNQFHPTCFYNKNSFLITEALRGEGAYLIIPKTKKRFMLNIDIRKELAPRDIVTKSILKQLNQSHKNYVFLDITHKPKLFILFYFPTIYIKLKKKKFDLTKQQIPIIPGSHYTCGGIMINKTGKTDLKNLYAIGETSYSGLHGANRIASNSLLECIILAISCAINLNKRSQKKNYFANLINEIKIKQIKIKNNNSNLLILIDTIKRNTSYYLGIKKNYLYLNRSKNINKKITKKITRYFVLKNNLVYSRLYSIWLLTQLLLYTATKRAENRGLYYNENWNYKKIKFEKPIIIDKTYEEIYKFF